MSSNDTLATCALTFAAAVACLAPGGGRPAYGAEADEFLSKVVGDPARPRASGRQWQAVVSGLQESESRPSAADRPRIAEAYLRSPLSFVARREGKGAAEFSASGPGFSLWLTPVEAVMQAVPPPAIPAAASATPPAAPAGAAPIRLRLVGANADPAIAGEAPLPTRTNYLIGNDREQWRTGVPSFGKVRYRDVYPGTDLVYYGNHRQLEYDFVLAPGADPSRIAIAFDGATPAIAPNGDLAVRAGQAEMRFRRPVIYQEGSHGRRQVDGRWKLAGSGRAGFEVAAYDRGKPLVIDPVLAYSTLLGGSGNDYGSGIAVDPSGDFYVTGDTCSPNFPTTAGAYQQSLPLSWYCPYGGTQAGFVAKFAALSGKATGTDPAPPLYITYLGAPTYGSFVSGIAADAAGNAYVAGNTYDNNFPVTSGAFQTLCAPSYHYGNDCAQSVVATCGPAGSSDNGFVAKLNPEGTSLVYSTFIGGQGFGQFSSIAVDSAGEAYVAGWTDNQNGNYGAYCGGYQPSGFNYPTTPGAYQTVTRDQADHGVPNEEYWWVFSKLSADGSTLLYSTELYGTPDNSQNYANAIAINPSDGTAYVVGQTGSAGFPSTPGVAQPALKGGQDAFIARFDPSQSGTASLVFGTFLGGSGDDSATGIAVDSTGTAYVAGGTGSQVFESGPISPDFPTTAGSFQPTCPGLCSGDAGWVAKLSPAGKKNWATYLGGTGNNTSTYLGGIAVGSNDQPIVTGCTSDGGSSNTFPLVNQIPGIVTATGNYSSLVVVTKFSASGKTLLLSNIVGGAGDDCGHAIALDANGNPYVVGDTDSSVFPTTPGAFQTGGSGQTDTLAFTIRNTDTDVGVSATPSPNPAIHGETLTYTIVAENTGLATADSVVITAQTPVGTTFQSAEVTAGSCTVPPVGTRGNVICSGFNLAPEASATLTLDVLVRAASGATITDAVTVNKHANDYDLANNTATVSVPVQ